MKTLMTTLFALVLSAAAYASGVGLETVGPTGFDNTVPRILIAEEHFNDARDMFDYEEPAPAREEEATAVEPGIGVDDDYTLRLREGRDSERSVDDRECFLGINMTEC